MGMFVTGRPFQPSVMLLVRLDPAWVEGALGQAPCLTCDHYTRLERLDKEKHSSLFDTFLSNKKVL